MGNLAAFNAFNHALPIRTVKISPRPPIVGKVGAVSKAMRFCIIFKQLLLIDNRIAVACQFVVAAQPLIKGCDFSASCLLCFHGSILLSMGDFLSPFHSI